MSSVFRYLTIATLIAMFFLVMNTPNAPVASSTPKVGDVMVSSWGYEQTNVDFYQVVGVTAASVKLRKVDSTAVAHSLGTIQVIASRGRFVTDKVLTKRVRVTENGYAVRMSDYASAHLWDGSPQFATAGGYGH